MGIIISKKSRKNNSLIDSSEMQHPPIERTQSESTPSRQLWWKPKRNIVGIHNESVKYDYVKPKIDSLGNVNYRSSVSQAEIHDESLRWLASPRIDSLSNASWSSSTPRVSVEHRKLSWNAQPKINSLENIHYKPPKPLIEIYHEKQDYQHVSPRINTGFVD